MTTLIRIFDIVSLCGSVRPRDCAKFGGLLRVMDMDLMEDVADSCIPKMCPHAWRNGRFDLAQPGIA